MKELGFLTWEVDLIYDVLFQSGKELIPQDKDGNQIIAAIDYLDTWKVYVIKSY